MSDKSVTRVTLVRNIILRIYTGISGLNPGYLTNKKKRICLMRFSISRLTGFLMIALCMMSLACDRIHEELDTCPTGVRLRFVYDYNMEFANAFPSQVDCLTLLVYDSGGRFLRRETAFKSDTENEDWRMDLKLEPGRYMLLAYGGMECQDASFSFVTTPSESSLENLEVRLNNNLLTSPVGHPLHHLFYGRTELTVPEPGSGTGYVEETVYMLKDTNDIRLILANADGTPVVGNDFEFSLTTDNTLLNYLNDVVPTGNTTFYPWTQGNALAGVLPEGDEYSVAYAEISTSRLIHGNYSHLVIKRQNSEEPVISIPLIKILLLLKSERFDYMGEQEFLDRNSRWNLTFFLAGDGSWLNTRIVINDWVVRINMAEI